MKEKEIILKAIAVFQEQQLSVFHLLRAADVYAHHILADVRQIPVNQELISGIVKDGCLSNLNLGLKGRIPDAEYDKFQEVSQLKKICEQIVLSVYTALEQYLILKFKEYLEHSLHEHPEKISKAIFKSISFRSLNRIKDCYQDYFDIHLPSFESEEMIFESVQGGFDESWFKPKSSWDGLTMLSKARNEIAHEGTSKTYKITSLVDAYAPLYFMTDWVGEFNSSFDYMIYENQKDVRVIKHDEKYAKIVKQEK